MNKLIQYNSRRVQYLLINVLRKLQSNIFNPSLRVLTFATDSLQNISLKSDRKETVQKRLKTTVIKLLTVRRRGSKVFTSPSKIKGTLNKFKKDIISGTFCRRGFLKKVRNVRRLIIEKPRVRRQRYF